MNDAQIARQWAEANINAFTPTVATPVVRKAIARHILDTTTPPTMADVEWDGGVHGGLVARLNDGDEVCMVSPDWVDPECIICINKNGAAVAIHRLNLTPTPGTKINLTLWREPEPESTPDHPTELTTEADYRNAPTGTVVADEGAEAWTKDLDRLWETFGIISGYNNYAMSGEARQVLRWGWEA